MKKRNLNDINGRIAAAKRAEWQRFSLIVGLRGEKMNPNGSSADRSGEKSIAGKDLCLSL